jgi:aldose 1-epimerase
MHISDASPRLSRAPFGTSPDGTPVDLVTLRNRTGMEVRIATYGGIILSLLAPDRDGEVDDVVLGFDALPTYFTKSPYFGSLVGRYANRIARGQFTLDDVRYTLATNNPPNHLHGGNKGWDKVVWAAETFEREDRAGVVLRYVSVDGEEGFPGTVTAEVVYTLLDTNQFVIEHRATTDKATVLNLTQHTYFNLAGTKADDVLGHELHLYASKYTPVDETMIPTGELASVGGTPFDFRTPTTIGARIDAPHPQLLLGAGYDHNVVVDRTGPGLVTAARVVEPTTGRTLEVATTQPGMQFYTANHLHLDHVGKGGRTYGPHAAFCLETQHFPDSPNQPSFPTTTLRPGDEYRSTTTWTWGKGG